MSSSSVALKSIAKIKGGKRLPKGSSLQTHRNSHPYLRIVDMGAKNISKINLQYVPDEVFSKISRYITNTDDILLSIVGTIGLVSIVDEELDNASLTENCVKITLTDKNFLPEFLYYYLSSDVGQHEIKIRQVGSTQPKLPLYNIEQIPVPALPHEKQIFIAKILGDLDRKIELNRRMNETLEQIGQALFKKYFVNNTKQEEVKMTNLGALISPKRGTSLTRSNMKDGNVPVVSGGLEPSGYHSDSNTTAPVITVSASGANAGFVRLWNNPVWSADSSFIDKTVTENVYFFYVFLKRNQNKIYSMQTGAAQPHIYPSHIERLEIISLQEEEINNFNDLVQPLFARIGRNEKEVRILTKLRDSLLPKLMSGEIKV